jgi:hypothetical protein
VIHRIARARRVKKYDDDDADVGAESGALSSLTGCRLSVGAATVEVLESLETCVVSPWWPGLEVLFVAEIVRARASRRIGIRAHLEVGHVL